MAPRANLGPKPLGISCEHDLMGRANLNLDLRYNLDTIGSGDWDQDCGGAPPSGARGPGVVATGVRVGNSSCRLSCT